MSYVCVPYKEERGLFPCQFSQRGFRIRFSTNVRLRRPHRNFAPAQHFLASFKLF